MDDFLQQEVQYCGEGGIMSSGSSPQSRGYEYDVLHNQSVARCFRSVVSEVPHMVHDPAFWKQIKHRED